MHRNDFQFPIADFRLKLAAAPSIANRKLAIENHNEKAKAK
jgi:hypothetical protein